jgi:polyisoprenoid-binding protein YceI
MKLAATLCFGLGLALCTSLADASFVARPNANVSFTAVGPAGMHIVGTTHDLVVQEDPQGAISITVALSGVTTGIGLRDKHMREKYLQVQSYPTAVLKVSRASLKLPKSGEGGAFDGEGTLTIHGKTKPVSFHYSAKSDGKSAYDVSGSMKIDMNEYGIETPKYLGITVKPAVDLSVSFTAEDKP